MSITITPGNSLWTITFAVTTRVIHNLLLVFWVLLCKFKWRRSLANLLSWDCWDAAHFVWRVSLLTFCFSYSITWCRFMLVLGLLQSCLERWFLRYWGPNAILVFWCRRCSIKTSSTLSHFAKWSPLDYTTWLTIVFTVVITLINLLERCYWFIKLLPLLLNQIFLLFHFKKLHVLFF